MSAAPPNSGDVSIQHNLAALELEEKKGAPIADADDVDDVDNDHTDDPSSSSSTLLDAAEKKRLANKRKKEKAKLRKQNKPPSSSSTPSPSSLSPEMQSLSASFPTLSMHRYFTSPLSLSFSPRKGRHLLTSSPIPSGHLLFSLPPYACVPRDATAASICHRCLSPSSVFLKCKECQFAVYCSPTCRTAHQRVHGLECKALQQVMRQQGETSSVRLMVRILVHRSEELRAVEKEKLKGKKGNAASPPSLHPGLTFPDVVSLQSHVDALSSQDTQAALSMLSAFVPVLSPLLKEGEDASLLLTLYCIIHTNAHTVQDVNKTALALGLYTAPSLMNHSCSPSAAFHFIERGEMQMRVLGSVKAGGELTYAYCDVYQPRDKRWQVLREVYKMESCDCERCCVPLEASWDRFIEGWQCNQCKTGLVKGQCEICNKPFTAEQIKEAEENAGLLLQQALSLYSAQQHSAVASTLKDKLLAPSSACVLRVHPFSYFAFQAYFMLLTTLTALGRWEEVVEVGEKARECLEGAGLKEHAEYADVLVVEGDALIKAGKKEEGKERLERAKESRERLYGRKHILYKDIQQKVNQIR